ncbi:hypothetical protein [Streptomyces sp. NPDC001388]|uniref:hypothetical protein n=1 Tax=unclassified Streptomyces TaxID=2593676 RepID=UPI00369484E8
MLFDNALDCIEQPDNEIHQSLGMVNLAPPDWFAAFDPEQVRDPDRGPRPDVRRTSRRCGAGRVHRRRQGA